MSKIEKKSFLWGILVSSAVFALIKWLLFLRAQSTFPIDLAMYAIISLLSLISIKIISRNWTNHLAFEMYSGSLKSKFALLKEEVDEYSVDILDYVYTCINSARFWSIPSAKIALPRHQYEHKMNWKKEREITKKAYAKRGIDGVLPEIFYFHHGLRLANENILKYIRDKSILDCGAFVGDSVFALRQYTNGTIYSFEFSRKAIAGFHKTMKKNGVTSGSVLIEAALGERCCVLNVADTGKHNNSVSICSDGNSIRMTTIDEEVKNREINVGFIKADLEGYGFKMIKGAMKTIKTQRPVLSIEIYHNYEELFEIKPFLQKEVENYAFEFQLHRFSVGRFVELTLFCYPKELAN